MIGLLHCKEITPLIQWKRNYKFSVSVTAQLISPQSYDAEQRGERAEAQENSYGRKYRSLANTASGNPKCSSGSHEYDFSNLKYYLNPLQPNGNYSFRTIKLIKKGIMEKCFLGALRLWVVRPWEPILRSQNLTGRRFQALMG